MADQALSNSEMLETYNAHRDYIKHEDNLINHRVTWGITVQSFLIATFGFCYQKKYEVAEKIMGDKDKISKLQTEIFDFNVFLFLPTMVGIAISYSNYKSVSAAVGSIISIKKSWDRSFRHKSEYAKGLPSLIGGGHPESGPKGRWLSYSLPVVFALFWIMIEIFIIISTLGITIRIANITPDLRP